MNSHGEIERNRVRNEENRDLLLNRHLSNSRQLRCREVSRNLSRKVSRKKPLTDAGIERYRDARRDTDTRSSIDREGVENLSRRQKKSRSIRKVLRQVSRKKTQTTQVNLDRSNRYQESIERTGNFSIDPSGVEEVSRLR